MGLYKCIRKFLMQFSGFSQLMRCTGNSKSWSNGITVTPPLVPFTDKSAALLNAVLTFAYVGIEQVIGSVGIHQNFTGKHRHVVTGCDTEQRLCRMRMYGCICYTRRCPIPEKCIHKLFRHIIGIGTIVKILFRWEGIIVQPIQQLFPIHPNDVQLWKMNMGINHSRHYYHSGIIMQECLRIFLPHSAIRSGF